jgi:hypothetical protein
LSITEWNAISARITALVEAGGFFLRTNDNDLYGTSSVLIGNVKATCDRIKSFRDTHANHLAPDAQQCLNGFVRDTNIVTQVSGFPGVVAAITMLASFRAEFEYHISDAAEATRSTMLRAFLHLQRSIVADQVVRERWTDAFNRKETTCEALGACHLLAHGIWAFKTSAEGERTDLVLGGELEITDEIRRASRGLVLTEWKLVRDGEDPVAKLEQAKTQAERYSKGILAGFEVESPRYLVIISKDFVDLPPSSINYEHRNIATDPSSPSRSTRRSSS